MRILGLDVGEKRIGVALSDPLGITAQGLSVINRSRVPEDVAAIKTIIEQNEVETIVVGLPLNMKGEQGPQAQRVKSFVWRLREKTDVPVAWVDERLTTVQGERALRLSNASSRTRKKVIDQVAAQLILQQYLDKQHGAHPE